MTTYIYERVQVGAYKAGPCAICGKRAERRETFGQTLNPFNRNADGSVKTRHEIWNEICAEARKWEQAGPVLHARCEDGAA